MSKITIVLEYKDGWPEPVFHAGMSVLGGEVVAVQFSDALRENELLRDCCPDDSAAEIYKKLSR